ncbi:alpha-2-macroglobulin family protein [Rhodanobacter denitrificans]|uniref:Alpha-2-macroglobulin n=1 Tax=Rhodanobacter denitrificans TaxID=666685 RepID=M4ND44_9GAMM|nr:alpha-2-macroglobulin [Rhodanobacter denitrificans]AGG87358.1 large extracellular alpha-helical protein [Rhodanobacter denitrificans]UJM86541.1 alpha-2-macroglobulin family protein [Rhodanobacter denitrificans]
MSRRSYECLSRRVLSRVLISLLLGLLLAACHRGPDHGKPVLQGAPAGSASAPAPARTEFALVSASSQASDSRTALTLRFNATLASAQAFDTLIAVTGPNGEAVSGSWSLDNDGKTLSFPFVQANTRYAVQLKAGLLAADGRTLGHEVKHDVYSGNLPAAVGFASHGSVLPARGTRGLPLVSMNVHDADVEFFRVRDDALSDLFCSYPRNGHRDSYELDHDVAYYNSCGEGDERRSRVPITQLADSVYANHYTLGGEPNERTVTYLPVQNIKELATPGVYMAVVKAGGTFKDGYDTATFFVSDLGLHLRVYRDNVLLHVASLRDGTPVNAVDIEIRDAAGRSKLKAVTGADGNALLAYKAKASDVLVARHGKDVSVLPFNRPALDVSNFDISGRRQAPFEVYAWSGRDLYRPGETLRASALLRDDDGKPMKAQSLFVRVKQPDGRTLVEKRLEPQQLNYFELSQAIPADAPTGLWQLEFRLDPSAKETVQAFPFHVEEFLPERLKVDLSSPQQRLAPGEPLKLKVASSYLYGAPADGNRFTAKLLVAPDVHPVAAMKDTFFGNPLVELPKSADDVVDAKLDAQGVLEQDVALPDDVKPVAPLAVTLSGSVYESGGRAVTRLLKRTYWPADALVGVRPLFDPKQGAESEAPAGFEIVRANANGERVAGAHLKVRLQRELRDFYWLYERSGGWQSNANQRLQLIEEKDIDVAAGKSAHVEFPVQWGSYRVEVYDPATKLTTVFPFFAGYSWDDENLGKEARPDKVKLQLDKARYRAGDRMKVTVTPPHDGPGVLLVESDHLLYTKNIDAKAGATFEIPVTKEWERHDVYVTALVFRGGEAAEHTTPARAMGVEYVAMDRNDRRVPLKLDAPALMRPGNPLEVGVQATGLAGQQAFVTLSAVDQGVLNITNYPVPDAWAWLFAKRALSVDAYDLYSRLIEAMDGAEAKLRYGGDMSGAALPKATRLNPKVQIVDLFAGPVAFDAQGKATLHVDVPDFNGSLRLAALAYTDSRYGNADGAVTVRAPLVVEPSTPRVMAAGDKAVISLDLKNLSGKDGTARVSVKGGGPITVDKAVQSVPLKDGAGTTVRMPVTAQAGAAVAAVDIHAELNDYQVDRHFEFAVRPAWPETVSTTPMALEAGKPERFGAAAVAGLLPATVNARITLSTLPPLPYAAALRDMLRYPYGCIEQTTSKGYAALILDGQTAKALGAQVMSDAVRKAAVDGALSRIASFQASNGHFSFWGGSSPIQTFTTPYVVDFMLDARDAGFAVPQDVLQKSLQRLNDDLLAGGHPYYEYEQHEHLRIADEAYSGFVLARVNRAPLGTLRAIFDNERQKLVAPLPLVHLGIALKLMGDTERAQKAVDEAFAWSKERPWYVGDYGSDLRDLALMVALTHTYGMSKPAYDAKLVDWARNATANVRLRQQQDKDYRWSWSYLSTQEQAAIARVAAAFDAKSNAPLAATLTVNGKTEPAPDQRVWSRALSVAEFSAGVSVQPTSDAAIFATLDVAGIPQQAPPADASQIDVRRSWFTTDGKPWSGNQLKEGDTLIVELSIEARMNVPDALVTDLLPGGLEVENLNLGGAQSWSGVVIDGIELDQHAAAAQIVHEEYRDDRYAAALNLSRGDQARVFYLVRAVTPGTYSVPPPLVEDMYRPAVRGIGKVEPAKITVVQP